MFFAKAEKGRRPLDIGKKREKRHCSLEGVEKRMKQ
jgi:hypothetical protein